MSLLIQINSCRRQHETTIAISQPRMKIYFQSRSNVRRFIDDVNEQRDAYRMQQIEVLGIVASKMRNNQQALKYSLPRSIENVEQNYGFPVLESIILKWTETSAGLQNTRTSGNLQIPEPISVLESCPTSKAAAEFRSLAAKVLQLTNF